MEDFDSIKIKGVAYPSIDGYVAMEKALSEGKSVLHWEEGNSLYPIIKSREYCLVKPIKNIDDVNVGDCVFCIVRGYHMIHRVTDIITHENEGKWFKIGDTWDTTFGWTRNILGIATSTGYFKKYD